MKITVKLHETTYGELRREDYPVFKGISTKPESSFKTVVVDDAQIAALAVEKIRSKLKDLFDRDAEFYNIIGKQWR